MSAARTAQRGASLFRGVICVDSGANRRPFLLCHIPRACIRHAPFRFAASPARSTPVGSVRAAATSASPTRAARRHTRRGCVVGYTCPRGRGPIMTRHRHRIGAVGSKVQCGLSPARGAARENEPIRRWRRESGAWLTHRRGADFKRRNLG